MQIKFTYSLLFGSFAACKFFSSCLLAPLYMHVLVWVFRILGRIGNLSLKARFMGPIWGRQDPGGTHVYPMNFTIWDSSSKFYFQQNTTREQYQKHFVDISKHTETLLHLPVVAREAAGLIKLATKTFDRI